MNYHSKPDFQAKAGPDSGQKRRTALLWFERIAFGSGMVLLLAFAGFKLEQNRSGDAGLTAFYQQIQTAGELESVLTVSPQAPASTAGLAASAPLEDQWQTQAPGFELWSEKRIREFQQSLQQETAPPLGVLYIERLGIEVPVYNGTDEFVLNRGVGRIKGTASIDGPGNLGIAGHRDGFFRGLKDIQNGDVLKLQTIHGAMQYRVGSTVIVDPDDVSVLAPTNGRTLTLVTCYPFYFVGHAPKRFIVQATAEPQIAMN